MGIAPAFFALLFLKPNQQLNAVFSLIMASAQIIQQKLKYQAAFIWNFAFNNNAESRRNKKNGEEEQKRECNSLK